MCSSDPWSCGSGRQLDDLVGRGSNASAIDTKWCGDLTEILTDEGKPYLATIGDLVSRRLSVKSRPLGNIPVDTGTIPGQADLSARNVRSRRANTAGSSAVVSRTRSGFSGDS